MKLKRYKLFFVLLPLTGFLGACNQNEQLKAVEEFSLTSQTIKQSSVLIIDDIDDTCIRKQEIENQKLSMINQPVRRGNNPVFPLVNIREMCQKWTPVAAQTNQINGTLITYIQSLGQLANGNTVTFAENVQTLGSSVDGLSKALSAAGVTQISLGEQQTQAGVNIVTSLLNLWSSQFRYENLKPAIICTDPYFGEYTSLLVAIINDIYLLQLQDEETFLNSRYNLAYQIALKKSGLNPAVLASEIVDLQNNYIQQIGIFDKRKQAAIAYIQILNETRGLHHALANNFRDKATDLEIDNLCKNYFPPAVNSLTVPVSSEGSNIDISPQQLIKSNELIKHYQRKITPLISKIDTSKLTQKGDKK